MSFIAIGINHQTAPVNIREKVAFTPTTLAGALKDYAQRKKNAELVILSTCNRTEIFANSEQISPADLSTWLAEIHQLDLSELGQYLYTYENAPAIRHLMQVACGLDSLILGEPQILGQVKQAFSEAKHVGTVNGHFEKIFQNTFAVAKKVRTQTDIGANAVSVAYAAVQLAKQIFSDLSNSHVMLIGAGETIELVAKHLAQFDLKKITVANRTLANAQALADALQTESEAITISEIPGRLAKADIVISSTASPLPILGQGAVTSALKERKYKPMLMIDLAVPRDIEEQVSEIDDVYLYTVDDLQHIVQQNVANREQAASQANEIIQNSVLELLLWIKQHKKIDLIKTYRDKSEATRQALAEKALAKLAQGEAPEKILQEFSYKLSQAMMHSPTKAMQKAIVDPKTGALDLLEDIFGRDNK
ncbi:glutamyl-tRNA reductase [Glaciecola punicea]|jgi:glutamyl-tRNA reductase|uniref:glutamyl-tRNA reductase n=1 Tax=Glaciecola punicea TaxID=56804 RepID=UPI000872EB2D|nr:glutamyl-tRNA reductase [Glaciecola punicea]OFA31646.1 glutamyl-tRNA reductase [Glaciecola punicea]